MRLHEFVERSLLSMGAAIEPEKHGLSALLPAAAAERLACPEFVRLGVRVPENREVAFAGFGSELLDRLVRAAEESPLLAILSVRGLSLKRTGFDAALARSFQFDRARCTYREAREATATYLCVWYRWKAVSDDVREGVQPVAVSEVTFASTPDLVERWGDLDLEERSETSAPERPRPPSEVLARARSLATQGIRQALAPFVDMVGRHRERDLRRIHEYFSALAGEQAAAGRGKPEPAADVGAERRAAIQAELESKAADLRHKYAIRVEVAVAAACRLVVPCMIVEGVVERRTTQRAIRVPCSPFSRELEPWPCEACGTSTFSLSCCDAMHLACAACATGGCARCRRASARA
jgi:hypothetical protein